MNSAQRLAARMVGNIRVATGCRSIVRPLTTATNRKVLTCVQNTKLCSLPTGIRLINTSGKTLKVIQIESLDDLYEVVDASNKTPAIVYFYAKECGRCKKFRPSLEAILEEKNGKVVMGTVDVDEGYDVAEEYGVGELPTIMVVTNRVFEIYPKDMLVGPKPDDEIRAYINKML